MPFRMKTSAMGSAAHSYSDRRFSAQNILAYPHKKLNFTGIQLATPVHRAKTVYGGVFREETL